MASWEANQAHLISCRGKILLQILRMFEGSRSLAPEINQVLNLISYFKMIQITKEQEPLYQELKEIEKQMRQAAQQARIYDNSLNLLSRTIKKNQLTIKQLQKLTGSRSIYVPLGRAFLKKDKDATVKEFIQANSKLAESAKDMEGKIKVFSDKANQKYRVLREGTERLTKKQK